MWVGSCFGYLTVNKYLMSEFTSTCKKKGYQTRKEAKAQIKYLNHNKGYGLTDVYYCEECSSWHTTHMDKKQSRKYARHLKNKKNKK